MPLVRAIGAYGLTGPEIDEIRETMMASNTKVLIIAAGMGSRIRAYTEDKPKCLLDFGGKTLLQRQLEVYRVCGAKDIALIRGYKGDRIRYEGIRYYENPDYESNNILNSLFHAEEEIDGHVVVAYSDILFESHVVRRLLESEHDISIVISIPIGLCAARNIAPNFGLFFFARAITVFFRAIPEFIMAMILVIAIGFGAMPGVIALGLHTMGFLAKFYAEDMEHVNRDPMEALGSMGASKVQVLAFAVVPQIMPSFVGYNLYILDRNIRMATMLGIVGAGGIGYELQSSFRMFEYPRVSAIILIIFATIFVIDMISSAIRGKIQ